jgi:hypothetical protein
MTLSKVKDFRKFFEILICTVKENLYILKIKILNSYLTEIFLIFKDSLVTI